MGFVWESTKRAALHRWDQLTDTRERLKIQRLELERPAAFSATPESPHPSAPADAASLPHLLFPFYLVTFLLFAPGCH